MQNNIVIFLICFKNSHFMWLTDLKINNKTYFKHMNKTVLSNQGQISLEVKKPTAFWFGLGFFYIFLALKIWCRTSQFSQLNRKVLLSLVLNALLMCLVIMDMVDIGDKYAHTFRQILIQNNSRYSYRI